VNYPAVDVAVTMQKAIGGSASAAARKFTHATNVTMKRKIIPTNGPTA